MIKKNDVRNKEKEEAGAGGNGRGQRLLQDVDTVRAYLNNVRKYPLLSSEEEIELAKKIAKGSHAARKRMVESNLRLVINIAKKYMNRGMPFQDLIEEGNIGLIRAAEKFKSSKECRFSTYATYWIKQAIERGIISQSKTVRLPIHITADIYKMIKVTRDLTSKLNREPSITEISEKMGVSGRYVKRLHTITTKNASLEASFREDSDQSLLDILEDDKFQLPLEMVEEDERLHYTVGLLDILEEKERAVIAMRFGLNKVEPQTLDSIGKKFGVTRERIRQIETKAMWKIRNFLKKQKTTIMDV